MSINLTIPRRFGGNQIEVVLHDDTYQDTRGGSIKFRRVGFFQNNISIYATI